MEKYFEIKNKKIYVEILGEENAPALLYIHGGPGTGSYDFAQIQGKALSKDFKLILVDQRGVLRSEPLTDSDTLSPYDIIEDFECIRKELNIKSWTIISHSFGGYLTLLYYSKYPYSIDKIIFECPSFDLGLSLRELFRGASEEYKLIGNLNKANACEKLLSSNMKTKELWNELNLLNELCEKRHNIYVHANNKNFMNELIQKSNIDSKEWAAAATHLAKLIEDGEFFESAMNFLKQIKCHALLITGRYDHVTGKEQIEAFNNNVSNGEHIEFSESAHFPRYEQSEEFSKIIINWCKTPMFLEEQNVESNTN